MLILNVDFRKGTYRNLIDNSISEVHGVYWEGDTVLPDTAIDHGLVYSIPDSSSYSIVFLVELFGRRSVWADFGEFYINIWDNNIEIHAGGTVSLKYLPPQNNSIVLQIDIVKGQKPVLYINGISKGEFSEAISWSGSISLVTLLGFKNLTGIYSDRIKAFRLYDRILTENERYKAYFSLIKRDKPLQLLKGDGNSSLSFLRASPLDREEEVVDLDIEQLGSLVCNISEWEVTENSINHKKSGYPSGCVFHISPFQFGTVKFKMKVATDYSWFYSRIVLTDYSYLEIHPSFTGYTLSFYAGGILRFVRSNGSSSSILSDFNGNSYPTDSFVDFELTRREDYSWLIKVNDDTYEISDPFPLENIKFTRFVFYTMYFGKLGLPIWIKRM